ncbi:hypothetical protein THAOC_15134, partial [Thalassiosira oceanica]
HEEGHRSERASEAHTTTQAQGPSPNDAQDESDGVLVLRLAREGRERMHRAEHIGVVHRQGGQHLRVLLPGLFGIFGDTSLVRRSAHEMYNSPL